MTVPENERKRLQIRNPKNPKISLASDFVEYPKDPVPTTHIPVVFVLATAPVVLPVLDALVVLVALVPVVLVVLAVLARVALVVLVAVAVLVALPVLDALMVRVAPGVLIEQAALVLAVVRGALIEMPDCQTNNLFNALYYSRMPMLLRMHNAVFTQH